MNAFGQTKEKVELLLDDALETEVDLADEWVDHVMERLTDDEKSMLAYIYVHGQMRERLGPAQSESS